MVPDCGDMWVPLYPNTFNSKLDFTGSVWSLIAPRLPLHAQRQGIRDRALGDIEVGSQYRWVPLYPNTLNSKLDFAGRVIKTTSQSLLCVSTCLIRFFFHSKDFYLVLFVQGPTCNPKCL